MYSARRVLCAVLVFVVLAACVIPVLTPPARAVAVVDDAIVIGVGLMFAGLSGITFSRSDHAVSAIQKFLTDCADVAQQIATLAAESVQDGIFKFTATNKLIYATIVAAMRGYFTSTEGTGSLNLGSSFMPLYYSNFNDCKKADIRFKIGSLPNFVVKCSNGDVLLFVLNTSSDGRFFYRVYVNDELSPSALSFTASTVAFDFFVIGQDFRIGEHVVTSTSSYISFTRVVAYSWAFSADSLVSMQIVGDNVTYLQDAAVDGTSALDQFEQLPEPETDPDDDDKPVEVPFVPLPIPNELETARRGLNQDADGNPLTDAQGNPLTDADGNPLTQAKPGIVPSERIGALTDAISQAKTDTPTPDNPNDNPDDERTKRHDADWQNLFPFCIPFDLIEFLGVLAADPVAPKFDWRIYAPNVVDYTLEIDLSPFDSVAKICRTMELLAFCIGLILITRNIIRG